MSNTWISKVGLIGQKPDGSNSVAVFVDSRAHKIKSLTMAQPKGVVISIWVQPTHSREWIASASITPPRDIMVPDICTMLKFD